MKGFILAILVLIPIANADDFVVTDRTCEVKIEASDDRLQNQFIDLLKEKGYRPVLISPERPLYDGDLTASFDKEHLKDKIYRDCKISLVLKRQGQRSPEGIRETIVKHTTVRSLPRITFRGHERCIRGLRDAFVHLPPCKRP